MIYRVGDGDNPAYDYSSQLKPAKNTEGQEKFSLDRQKEQTVPEKKEEKGEDKKLHEKPGVDIKKQGVRLELSGRAVQDDEAQADSVQKNKTADARPGSFVSFFKNLLRSVRDFLYQIWNEPSSETVISEEVSPEEAERYTQEYYKMKGIDPQMTNATGGSDAISEPKTAETEADRAAKEAERDEKIRKQLRSGNLEQVISLLTDDGRRTMAKNSTLLTYYDKSGKLTQLNASDRERILHGDRNVRKL